jgi:altronate dehydratase small subunit
MKRAFQVHAADNVATLLADVGVEQIEIVHAGEYRIIPVRQDVGYGHKVALADLHAGEPILKYGIPIGTATRDIRQGEWVHLHNCASAYDTRSTTLDVESGAATDTPYL